jgi:hypothetical protein
MEHEVPRVREVDLDDPPQSMTVSVYSNWLVEPVG